MWLEQVRKEEGEATEIERWASGHRGSYGLPPVQILF